MNKNQKLLDIKLQEFNQSLVGFVPLMEQLQSLAARHQAAIYAINRRLDRGDAVLVSAEFRSVVADYPASLRLLGLNALKLAEQAGEISKLL